jgi:precorrin-6A/cobalt-precorrin-6A reductase
VEPPEPPLPADLRVVLARGPFTVSDETTLLRTHRIDVLVTKDSGGAATAAKLTAARRLGLPVVVIRRPPLPQGVTAVPDVLAVLDQLDPLVTPAVPPAPPSSGAADMCP